MAWGQLVIPVSLGETTQLGPNFIFRDMINEQGLLDILQRAKTNEYYLISYYNFYVNK